MRMLFVSALGATLALAGSAVAQQPLGDSLRSPANQPPGSSKSPAGQEQNTPNEGLARTQQEVRQDLQQAGFRDIQFLESAYVVQATSKDGNKVVMMISPHQFSAVESLNRGPANGRGASGQPSGSATTGSGTAPNAIGGAGHSPDSK